MEKISDQKNTLTDVLKHFESTEANLVKLERLWNEIKEMIPEDFSFGDNLVYEDKCKSFETILPYLPKIDGWQPYIKFYDLKEIAQIRFDYMDIDDSVSLIRFNEEVFRAGSELSKYRFLLNKKRRKLICDQLISLIKDIDMDIQNLKTKIQGGQILSSTSDSWLTLREHFNQIDPLLGNNSRPGRWNDMRRHMGFAEEKDAHDIENFDWPVIKKTLMSEIYEDNEPIPTDIVDVADLIIMKPSGPIPKKLNWKNLTPEDFERLIFSLFITTPGYQNCSWLTKTNAPDRGRDLSVELVSQDPLNGASTQRIIVQCKH